MNGIAVTRGKPGSVKCWLVALGLVIGVVLAGASAERVSAGTNPVLEPGFETVNQWTFASTMDTYYGRRTTAWETEGSRSYEIRYQATSGLLGAGAAELYQDNVDLTDADAIIFDTQLYGWSLPAETLIASVYIDDAEVWSQEVPLSTTVYYNQSFDVSGYTGPHRLTFHLENQEVTSTTPGGRFRFDNVRISYTSESIGLAGQNYEDTVAWITFPAAEPGTIVANPYNNQSETQQFGPAGEALPVATLINYGSAAYIMYFEISAFENDVVESEYYLINDKGDGCADADAINNLVEFDDLIVTGVTVLPGPDNARDLYLKILLSDRAGKTGWSYLTILGEKE
jgi:hypothetical protein